MSDLIKDIVFVRMDYYGDSHLGFTKDNGFGYEVINFKQFKFDNDNMSYAFFEPMSTRIDGKHNNIHIENIESPKKDSQDREYVDNVIVVFVSTLKSLGSNSLQILGWYKNAKIFKQPNKLIPFGLIKELESYETVFNNSLSSEIRDIAKEHWIYNVSAKYRDTIKLPVEIIRNPDILTFPSAKSNEKEWGGIGQANIFYPKEHPDSIDDINSIIRDILWWEK